jgi:tetratricopeptide (TPR) repeat protein
MTRWQRRFAVLIALEWAVVAVLMVRNAGQPKIPAVKLDHVDAEVAEAIVWHQYWMNLANSQDWQSLGKLYLAYGCLPEAEICCRHAAELAPESKDAFYLWAVALDRLGRLDDAEQRLSKAIELGAGGPESWTRLGRIKLRQESPTEAEQAFRTALKLDADAVAAAIGLARILLHEGRAAEVAGVLLPFLETRPKEHAPCQLLARAESALGQQQAAARHLLDAEWRPELSHFKDPQADTNRWSAEFGALRYATESRIAAAKGDAQSAAMLIQHALTLGWDDRFAAQAAAAYLQVKQPQEALSVLRKTVVVAGKSAYSSWLEGESYDMLGKKGAAQDAWEESTKLFGSENAHRWLADLLLPQNQTVGERHLALALYFGALDRLQAGDPDKTAQMLQASLELKPDQSLGWYFLGETKRYQGDADGARAAYRRALELQPELGRAEDALSALDLATDSGENGDDADRQPLGTQ